MVWYPIEFDVSTNEDWHDPLKLINKATNEPINLTGYSFDMHIRETPNSDYAVLALSTVNGRLIVDAAAGTVSTNVSVDIMRTIKPGSYGCDIRWKKDGVFQTFARGTVIVNEGYTR